MDVPRLEGARVFKRTEDSIFARALFVAHSKNERDGIGSGSDLDLGRFIVVTLVVRQRGSVAVGDK